MNITMTCALRISMCIIYKDDKNEDIIRNDNYFFYSRNAMDSIQKHGVFIYIFLFLCKCFSISITVC